MITYPHIDPVVVRLGPLQVHWYGLMYVLGFAATYLLVNYQLKRAGFESLKPWIENLNMGLIISVVVGGRLGYVLFYNFAYYLHHPLEILATWQGGMSFHGALLGVLFFGLFYCNRHGLDFWQIADIYVVTIPIGLGLGRLGNFINGELFGRPTTVAWAMVFPAGGPLPRHPSQLYESFLEGFLLFVILWLLKEKQRQYRWPTGAMLGFFLFFYGLFRATAELFRQPDAQLGFLAGSLTMGQLLSSVMVVAGISILYARSRQRL